MKESRGNSTVVTHIHFEVLWTNSTEPPAQYANGPSTRMEIPNSSTAKNGRGMMNTYHTPNAKFAEFCGT
jgi:hypothetical protein